MTISARSSDIRCAKRHESQKAALCLPTERWPEKTERQVGGTNRKEKTESSGMADCAKSACETDSNRDINRRR